MPTSKRPSKPAAVRRKATTASSATRSTVVVDDDDDSAALPASAPDPLAAEPLSAAEIREFEVRRPGMSEQREAMLETLRKGAEVKLPLDPDDAESLIEATDQHLEVHTRPKRKR